MGFIKAFTGALSGTFADEWVDFYKPMEGVPATAALYPAVKKTKNNNGVGENTKGTEHIITNGSKIIVPEGTALITMQDGAITGCIAEPGGFIFTSDDPNSQSMFAGDGMFAHVWKATWDKVKGGGIVRSEQKLVYVNMRPIPKNPFGTQGEIYWDDSYLGVQAGAIARGEYTIQIVDPMLFVKNFNTTKYLEDGEVLDLADEYDPIADQLFKDVVGCLGSAFSNYTNDPEKQNRMNKIQGDAIGFAKALSSTVDNEKQWRSMYGLEIVTANVIHIEYDANTKELFTEMQRLDALNAKNRGNQNVQQATAKALEGIGEAGGLGTMAGLAFMGMGNGNMGGMVGAMGGGMQQQPQEEDPMEKLKKLKDMLDAGLITQEDYDAQKAKILGGL